MNVFIHSSFVGPIRGTTLSFFLLVISAGSLNQNIPSGSQRKNSPLSLAYFQSLSTHHKFSPLYHITPSSTCHIRPPQTPLPSHCLSELSSFSSLPTIPSLLPSLSSVSSPCLLWLFFTASMFAALISSCGSITKEEFDKRMYSLESQIAQLEDRQRVLEERNLKTESRVDTLSENIANIRLEIERYKQYTQNTKLGRYGTKDKG